jgi:hypothetical protein
VGHEVTHGHRGSLRLGIAEAPAAPDAGAGEGRNEFRHRIIELEAAEFVTHHRRRGGDDLGHRIQADDGIEPERPVGGDVGETERGCQRRLAVP